MRQMAASVHPNRAALGAGQLEQLRALLAELLPANSFYARKFNAAGAGFDIASLADYSARFPFTTKAEIVADQLASPPFGTNLTYPLESYTRFHQTSGTSGAPLRWLDTPENWEGMIESWLEIFGAAGVHPTDRVMFAFSFGPFIGFWLAFESAQRLGCLCLPGGGLSTNARLRLLLDNQATVLCCTPTYAIRLGEAAQVENWDLKQSRVRTIVVAGEPGGSIPATRRRIESLWPGARVFDHHGMTEVGPVTFECPATPGLLHVIESAYFAEIIDPATAAPAAQGELILTTLGRVGSPLLRYRTGDLVKRAAAACGCGRQYFTLDGGILGRVDDMVIVRGVNVYPGSVEEILRGFPEVAEYRATVSQGNSLAELKLEIEPSPACANPVALAVQIGKAFETTLALRVPVISVPLNSLPRFEMKASRWVRQ